MSEMVGSTEPPAAPEPVFKRGALLPVQPERLAEGCYVCGQQFKPGEYLTGYPTDLHHTSCPPPSVDTGDPE